MPVKVILKIKTYLIVNNKEMCDSELATSKNEKILIPFVKKAYIFSCSVTLRHTILWPVP